MTSERQTNDSLPDGPYAIVEAFIDGEPVAPEALKHALADPSARDYLADLLILRGEVARMAPTTLDFDRSRASWRVGWVAAAAAVLVSLMGGFFAGQRVVAPVVAQGVEAIALVSPAPSAPAPTRVIKLESGVNWTEHSGGR